MGCFPAGGASLSKFRGYGLQPPFVFILLFSGGDVVCVGNDVSFFQPVALDVFVCTGCLVSDVDDVATGRAFHCDGCLGGIDGVGSF